MMRPIAPRSGWLPTSLFASTVLGFVSPAQAQDSAPIAPVSAPSASAMAGKRVPGTVESATFEDKGQKEAEERLKIALPAESPEVIYTFTTHGGTMREAILQNPRYTRKGMTELPGVPASKVAEGPIDLVSTWGSRLLPFGDQFIELSAGAQQASLVLRRGDVGTIAQGVLKAPANRSALKVDQIVAVGDRLRITAPESLAGEYEVGSVGVDGEITPTKPFAQKDVSGVIYEVVRVGSPKDLIARAPVYTRVSKDAGLPLVYVWPNPETDQSPIWVERRFEAGKDGHALELVVTVHNVSQSSAKVLSGLRIGSWQHPDVEQPGIFSGPIAVLQSTCYVDGSTEHQSFHEMHAQALSNFSEGGAAQVIVNHPTGSTWASADSNYFTQAAVARSFGELGGQCRSDFSIFSQSAGAYAMNTSLIAPSSVELQPNTQGCVPGWLLGNPSVSPSAKSCDSFLESVGVSAGASDVQVRSAYEAKAQAGATAELTAGFESFKNRRAASWQYSLYSGPKEIDRLASVDASLTDGVQFGWLRSIGKVMHSVMVWLYEGVNSWPFAIILLTILLKLLTWPLSHKSYVSMQRMKTIQPKLTALKEKYGNDRQRFAQEQMALMRKEGVNPFASCLPMLIQIPIWMGLYGAILGSVELYHEPLGLWIQDLSSADPYFILPVVLGILMYIQTAMTPQAGADPMQAKMMKYMMPIMFTVFMLFLPSGLVLYILINTILTIVQNVVIKRKLEAQS